MRICKNCKKEITNTTRSEFCGQICSYHYQLQKHRISYKINALAKKYNFDVKNKEKIINAKLMLFSQGDVYKCPCDAENPERFCGSALCISDIITKGHCHCHLFYKKV